MQKAMTTGKEWKHILLFTLPIMAGQFLQQLYSAVDGIVVGNFVGEDALSAVGTCTPVTMIYIAIAIGLSAGCSIVVAQYYGAQKLEKMRRAVSTGLILLVGVGLVLSAVTPFLARPILGKVLAVDPLLLDAASTYLAIYCIGLVLQMSYNGVASILRSLGDSKATLYFLLVSSVVNTVLDLLFVIVLRWGVAGAAIATVLAQGLSAVVSFVYMFKKHAILRFRKGEFRFHKDMCVLSLKLAIPTMLQQLVISCGNLVIQRMVNHFGRVTMAAFTAGLRIECFAFVPIFGYSIGLSTFTGQNVGAGKPDRVSRGLKATLVMSLACCGCVSLIMFFFAGPLVGLFGVSGAALEQGIEYLRFLAPFLLIFSAGQVFAGVLQGSGDVVFAACNTFLNLGIRVIAAYIMGFHTPIGYHCIWYSLPFGWTVGIVMMSLRYRFGPWRKKSVVSRESAAAGKEN